MIHGLARVSGEVAKKIRLYGNTGALPTLDQIQKYSSARNESENGPACRASVDRLEAKCSLMASAPDDDSEPFVIGYHFTDKDNFAVVVSSKELMKKFSLTKRRAMDGTYKLLKSGFPVLIYGVDDAAGHFHPIAIAVSSTERCKQITSSCHCTASVNRLSHLFFLPLALSWHLHTGPDFAFVASSVERYQPTTQEEVVLMSDAAEAIRNGLRECMNTAGTAGGDASSSLARVVRVISSMCWFHCEKGCRSMAQGRSKGKSGKLSNQDFWEGPSGVLSQSISDDLRSLHHMPYPYTDAFDVALELFYEMPTASIAVVGSLSTLSFLRPAESDFGRGGPSLPSEEEESNNSMTSASVLEAAAAEVAASPFLPPPRLFFRRLRTGAPALPLDSLVSITPCRNATREGTDSKQQPDSLPRNPQLNRIKLPIRTVNLLRTAGTNCSPRLLIRSSTVEGGVHVRDSSPDTLVWRSLSSWRL